MHNKVRKAAPNLAQNTPEQPSDTWINFIDDGIKLVGVLIEFTGAWIKLDGVGIELYGAWIKLDGA